MSRKGVCVVGWQLDSTILATSDPFRTPVRYSMKASSALRIFAVGFLAGLGACADPTGSGTPPLASIVSGEGQSATRGTVLPLPLVLRATSGGRPAVGVQVTWQPSAGGLSAVSRSTDSTGRASAVWTLGPAAGPMTLTAMVGGTRGTSVQFTAQALAVVTITADPAGADQRGVVGTTLPVPLRVTITFDSAPAAGVPVVWRSANGSPVPSGDTTDAAGAASSVLQLGLHSGPVTVWVRTSGAPEVAAFRAFALAGPASRISGVAGNAQSVPINRAFEPIKVYVTDSFGNAVVGQSVLWSVVSGPVVIRSSSDTTDVFGWSVCDVAPTGAPGTAVVRASLPGGQAFDDTLRVTGLVWEVELLTYEDYRFHSLQNNTMPAVDTVPVGTTVRWVLSPFDYDSHSVTSEGTPAFTGGGDFPYANPSTVSVTFTAPGTYRYKDAYYGGTGTVVVH